MKPVKYLGAKIIFGILLIAFCGCILSFTKETGNMVYSFFGHQPVCSVSDVPVIMHIDKSFAFYDVSQTAHINNCVGSVSLSNAPYGLKLYFSVYRMILTGSVIICLWLMLTIINTVFKGNPFIPQNGKRLKALALIVGFVPLVLQISANFVIKKIISQLTFLNLTLRTEVWGRSTLIICIFSGLILFAIAEVFRIGIAIKEEQELTV